MVVGVAGEDAPSVVMRTLMGRRHSAGMPHLPDAVFGAEALQRRATHRIRYPVERKIITNFGDMEHIWHHLFYQELKVAPEEHPVLLTYAADSPPRNQEKMLQIMFETFNVPAVHLGDQATLALFSAGKTTGVVVDIGASGSLITPVYEGRDITDYLLKILNERGYSFTTTAERMLVDEIKCKLGFCSVDFDAGWTACMKQSATLGSGVIDVNKVEGTQLARLPNELLCRINDVVMQNTYTRCYTLPDGQVITLDAERFRCVEPVFAPCMIGFSATDLTDNLYTSIYRCSSELRKLMWGNVMLSGGSTLFPGMAARLQKRLTDLAPADAGVRVIAPPERKYATWIGGSILGSMPDFASMTVSTAAYAEYGANTLMHMFH
ncbi:Actin [Acanthamoeba castellanii str. Neff]|uniref:Actin n=1 Tax=Acanthamoeba castellanii (strain ATCC 30010 / Neff) TaxID=1257118 RepID=L8H3X8_ACACF|nr:Actin [Acanthamoeba castellanii str. Neff]ELR20214.1 Actin [Acanthamoeba castellanii str. Neff]